MKQFKIMILGMLIILSTGLYANTVNMAPIITYLLSDTGLTQEEASDAVLAQIGVEGDSGDTVNSVVTVAQLGAILPPLTGIVPANEAAYQDYIDSNPDLFSEPASQGEVQTMIDMVNAAQSATVDPAESNVTAGSSSIAANGVATSTITVTVKDTNANFVTDATVTLDQTGSSTISSVTNNNDGTYTFTVSSTTEETVTYTATANSVEITATIDVTFTALVYGGVLDTTFGSKDTLDTTFGIGGIVEGIVPAHDIILDSADHIYIALGDDVEISLPGSGTVNKYDSNGTLEFSSMGSIGTSHYGVTLDDLGNIYTTGMINPNGTTDLFNDLISTKFTSTGVFDSWLGGFVYSAGFYNIGYDLVTDSSGSVYVTGSQGYETLQDMVILKYTSTGDYDTNFGVDGVVVHRGSSTGPVFNRGYGVILDDLNNIYVTGVSSDDVADQNMVILKYTGTGILDITFGSAGIATYNSTSYDYGREIVRDSAGNLYVVGGIRDAINSDDIAVWKYTSAGVLDTTFGTGGMVVYDNSGTSDKGFGLVLDSLGSIYVTGYSYNGTDNDMVVLKYTSAGVLDSTFDSDGILVYDSGDNDQGEGIAIDSKGNLIVTGSDTWKYTATGIVVHDNAAGGDSSDTARENVVDSLGNTYVVGDSWNGTDNDMVIWKYTKGGILDTTFGTGGFIVHNSAAGGNSTDNGFGITLDSSGNIYVAGYSDNGTDYDMVIWKYTSAGVLDTTFGSGGIVAYDNGSDDTGRDILLDSSDNIYVTGSSNNGTDIDMVTWKYSNTGILDATFGTGGMVRHHNAAGGNGSDLGYEIALDSLENIYVTGYSRSSSNGTDMVVWKYTNVGTPDATFGTGGFIVHNSAAGGNGDDYGHDIALDSSNNVYVTGSSNNGSDIDMVIWKLISTGALDTTFGTNGTIVHNSAAGGNAGDSGEGIVLNSVGDIYVSGYSNNGADMDMVIWKYTNTGTLDTTFAVDGIARYHDAAGGDSADYGLNITLDSVEDIFVTGYSANSNGNYDMVIWKYKD